jgi:hypothetical protein
MRQVEVSRTLVFNAPRQARSFFEALCADNLDIGRPEEMQLIFGRRPGTYHQDQVTKCGCRSSEASPRTAWSWARVPRLPRTTNIAAPGWLATGPGRKLAIRHPGGTGTEHLVLPRRGQTWTSAVGTRR